MGDTLCIVYFDNRYERCIPAREKITCPTFVSLVFSSVFYCSLVNCVSVHEEMTVDAPVGDSTNIAL